MKNRSGYIASTSQTPLPPPFRRLLPFSPLFTKTRFGVSGRWPAVSTPWLRTRVESTDCESCQGVLLLNNTHKRLGLISLVAFHPLKHPLSITLIDFCWILVRNRPLQFFSRFTQTLPWFDNDLAIVGGQFNENFDCSSDTNQPIKKKGRNAKWKTSGY